MASIDPRSTTAEQRHEPLSKERRPAFAIPKVDHLKRAIVVMPLIAFRAPDDPLLILFDPNTMFAQAHPVGESDDANGAAIFQNCVRH
jgi:hypothetical protein